MYQENTFSYYPSRDCEWERHPLEKSIMNLVGEKNKKSRQNTGPESQTPIQVQVAKSTQTFRASLCETDTAIRPDSVQESGYEDTLKFLPIPGYQTLQIPFGNRNASASLCAIGNCA